MMRLRFIFMLRSPSVRKVWIEIYLVHAGDKLTRESPSARKVWIEIVPVR